LQHPTFQLRECGEGSIHWREKGETGETKVGKPSAWGRKRKKWGQLTDHKVGLHKRVLLDEPLNHPGSGILLRVHREENLKLGILNPKKGLQIGLQGLVHPLQRLQN